MKPDQDLTEPSCAQSQGFLSHKETRRFQRVLKERMKGLEPSTFCMATRPDPRGFASLPHG